MLFWLWLLDALHWDNWWGFTVLFWLPSSNPPCESWSWSISSPTAGPGKSLLGSRKLKFAMPSAVPAWASPMDGHAVIQPVAPQPLWQTWLEIKATTAFYISRFWRNIRSNLLIYTPANSLYSYLRKLWEKNQTKTNHSTYFDTRFPFLKIKMTGMCMWPWLPHLSLTCLPSIISTC